MNRLIIDWAVANTLYKRYGFRIAETDLFFNPQKSRQDIWSVFPNAYWITADTRLADHSSRLTVEHVLALQLIPTEAWDDYLKAEFPNHKE